MILQSITHKFLALNVPVRIGIIAAILAAMFGGAILPASAALAPAISVTAIYPGSMVQLTITNLPANSDFTVTQGAYGTKGIGSVIAHFNSGSGGTQSYWFEILSDVRNNAVIDVRIDNGAGVVAWASFNNVTGGTTTSSTVVPTTAPTATPVYGTGGAYSTSSAYLKALHVQRGGIVVIMVSNLPPSGYFSVIIGPAGTKGVGGTLVAHVKTPASLPYSAAGSFEIPASVRTADSFDVRFDNGTYAFYITVSNWDF